MQLNQYGRIVQHAWSDLPNHYPYVDLGGFCILPNHVHAVILLDDDGRGGSSMQAKESSETRIVTGKMPVRITKDPPLLRGMSAGSRSEIVVNRHPLSEIVRAFKSFSARRINAIRKTPGVPVWQRNYYEHIIRNDDEYNRIQFYIETNPEHWMDDDENPREKP